jgi:hypothetical protein
MQVTVKSNAMNDARVFLVIVPARVEKIETG